jgi:hypothetical protein
MRKLALLSILFSALGHAQTICSFIGTSTCANTLMTYSSGTTQLPVHLLYNGYNPGTLPVPAQYVTYMQGAAPNVTTVYQSTFVSVAGSTGSISVMADDIVTVSINGTQIGVTKASQYNQVIAFPISAILTGSNTLTLAVQNTGGNTGVGFYAKIVPPGPPTTVTYQFSTPQCNPTGTVGSSTLTIPPTCTLTKVGP